MFGISPAVLYGTDHSGKMAFPVDFPYSHHGASTSFVGLTSLYLLSFSLLLLSRQPTLGLPPARRFTVTVATSPFDSSWDQSGSSPPCRSLLGVGSRSPEKTRDLTPTAVPFPYKIYSRDLHLFMYSVALCD